MDKRRFTSTVGDEKEKDRTLKRIFAGGGVMFLAVLISKVLGLAYRLITGRFLGPEDYGVLTLMITIYSSVTTFAYLNIQEGVQKYVSEYRGTGEQGRIRGTILSGLRMITGVSVIVGAALFGLSEFLAVSVFNEPRAIWPIRFIALSVPFLGVTKTLTNVTEGYEKMKPTAYTAQISVNVIRVAVTAALIFLGFNYLGAAFAFAFSIACGSFIAYYFYRKVVPSEVMESNPVFNYREIAVFSAPLLAGGVFGIISGQIDTYMLQFFDGTRQVGIYNAAYPFALLILSFSNVFSSILMSAASRLRSQGEESLNADIFRTVTKWISGITVPIFLVLFLFPRTALYLFGNEYFAAAQTLRILAAGFLLSALTSHVTNIYQAYDRTDLNFVTSVVLAVSNLVLNYILIGVMDMGIVGAAYATTASFAITAAFNVFMSYRFLGKSPFKPRTVQIWAIGAASIAAPFLLSNLLFTVTPKWFFIVDLAMFGSLYIALVAFTGALETEDRMILEAILEKVGLDEKYASIPRYTG